MESLKLDDFTKYKFLSGIKYSPAGGHIGFVCHSMDVEDNKYLSNIHIYNLENESLLKLTSLDEERSFIWKDEETILFPAIRNKKDKERQEKGEAFTTYYSINIHGGEANKEFEIPINVSDLKFVDENNILLTGSYDPSRPDFESLSDSEKSKAYKELKENKDYEILDEIPFWFNSRGYTNKIRNRLYLYNIENKELKPITDVFTNVNTLNLNEDNNKAIMIKSSFTDKMQRTSHIYIYDIERDTMDKISPMEDFNYSYCDFLEDKIIFAGKDMLSYGINENPSFYIMDYEGTNIKKISTNEFDYSIWNSVGSDCRYGNSQSIKVYKEHLYFVTTEGYNSILNRIDINGNIEKLTEYKGSVDGFDIIDGKIHFIGLRGLRLQEIYSLEDKVELQKTQFNEWVIEEKTLSTPEKIEFHHEVPLTGWVMKPIDYDENKSYPAILNIHGGPKTVYGQVFFHEMQYWANEGYFVFFCNPRGSDGYGNEFADIRGKYGTVDYEDLMSFTDLILKKYPAIDKERVGVTGGSYGGFMTNWIVGHTNRFAAAASQRSISNWISKFATTDIGYYFVEDQQAATPWSDVDKLWFHSPLKYADRVTTPTLFIHSEEDYRCWLPEGLQMFTALKFHGVESRLVMFRGENHELSRSGKPKHRIKRLEEITNWFNNYLK